MKNDIQHNLGMLEAFLDGLISEATRLKMKCHKARVASLTAGVSTPAKKKESPKIQKEIAIVLAKRRSKLGLK